MTNPEQTQRSDTDTSGGSVGEGNGAQADDRRGTVKPTDNPVPSSPQADEEAVRAGEETLERVKPY